MRWKDVTLVLLVQLSLWKVRTPTENRLFHYRFTVVPTSPVNERECAVRRMWYQQRYWWNGNAELNYALILKRFNVSGIRRHSKWNTG